MRGATNITRNMSWRNASGRRFAAAMLSFAILAVATTSAAARPPIQTARRHAAALGLQVGDARAAAAALQTRMLALSSDLANARRMLDRLQGRLVNAQRGRAAAQAELDSIQSRLNDRARQVFITLGPAASAVYLLGADSLTDLLDRSVMLDSVQQSDAALAGDVRAQIARLASAQDSLEQTTRVRARLLARIESRRAQMLNAFAAQQEALERLVGRQHSAIHDVTRLERRVAREAGALPFGEWAPRFLQHIGAPTCRDNLVVVMAWQANEFTQARWNPLATTHLMKRSTNFNVVGVQNYVSLTQGIRASVQTLAGGAPSFGYGAILDDLHACAGAMRTAEAIRASAWCRDCSNGGYVTELVPIVEQYFDRYTTLHV
ncbi:MAG: coiled-coil domain-containing protein [Actinomycetota bacterium]